MVSAIVAILFIALTITIPTAIALLRGLKFTPTNPNCKEDVNDVKMNITAIKVIVTFDAVAMLTAFILIQFIA